MPWLIIKEGERAGSKQWIEGDRFKSAVDSGMYEVPAGTDVAIRDITTGDVSQASADDAAELLESSSLRAETGAEAFERQDMARMEREQGGVGGGILTAVESGLGAATGGLTDWAAGEIIGEDYKRERGERRQVHSELATAGDIGGLVIPALVSGGTSLAAKGGAGLGARALAATPAGLVARVGAKGGIKALAAEGALTGVLQAGHEEALNSDPFSMERFASQLTSNVLLGAATGGVAGGVGHLAKAAGKGVAKARSIADDMAASTAKRAGIADDLSRMTRAELKVAETAEVAASKQASGAAKVQLADDIADLHMVSKVANIEKKLDKALTRHVGNMKSLAKNPAKALDTLERTEQALVKITKAGGDVDKLATVEGLLVKNRALQTRIADVAESVVTPRMQQIQDAIEFATPVAGEASKGLIRKAGEGAIFSAVTGAVAPVAGGFAPLIGAKATGKIADLIFGRAAKAGADAGRRTAVALEKLMNVGAKVGTKAQPLASKVLMAASFAPPGKAAVALPKATLLSSYKRVNSEILSQVKRGPNGITMRPEARAKVAQRLSGVRAVSPRLADHIETVTNRKVSFLADKLPKRPDYLQSTVGPDTYRPSNMELRTFARFVAAVEDPGAVEERLADGTLSPEDAEAYRTVYPELYADMQRQIMEQLPELRATLPYAKRLSLSIFTGVAVDPSLDPRIFRQYQSQFDNEPGSEQGTQAPSPQPQFGSVKVPNPTPAQERAG